jgi:hypothetical protein
MKSNVRIFQLSARTRCTPPENERSTPSRELGSERTHKVSELEHCALKLVYPKHLLKVRIQDVEKLFDSEKGSKTRWQVKESVVSVKRDMSYDGETPDKLTP